jgi:hypothetical protein
MRTIRFASVTRANTVYQMGDDQDYMNTGYYRQPTRYIASYVTEYPTYGDGTVQHGNAYCTSAEHLLDFVASLAEHLVNNPADVADLRWVYPIMHDKIDFARKVKYNSEKEQYYSKEERKVTSSKSKQYDKRYEVVPEWADGAIEAVMAIVHESYWGALDDFNAYTTIRDRADETEQWIDQLPMWDYDSEYANILQAWRVVANLKRAYELHNLAVRSMECIHHNWLDKKTVAA